MSRTPRTYTSPPLPPLPPEGPEYSLPLRWSQRTTPSPPRPAAALIESSSTNAISKNKKVKRNRRSRQQQHERQAHNYARKSYKHRQGKRECFVRSNERDKLCKSKNRAHQYCRLDKCLKHYRILQIIEKFVIPEAAKEPVPPRYKEPHVARK